MQELTPQTISKSYSNLNKEQLQVIYDIATGLSETYITELEEAFNVIVGIMNTIFEPIKNLAEELLKAFKEVEKRNRSYTHHVHKCVNNFSNSKINTKGYQNINIQVCRSNC